MLKESLLCLYNVPEYIIGLGLMKSNQIIKPTNK
jgi:hypothetical protein